MKTNTALLVIDAQANMFDPANPVVGMLAMLSRLGSLVARARAARVPVVFVRNCGGAGDPDAKGSPGWELHESLVPEAGELMLDKTTCDTFASTPLAEHLAARGVTHVVVAGLQSEFCVRETALGALAHKLAVTLVSDAHSTYDGKTRSAEDITAAVNHELAGRVKLARAEQVAME